MSYRYSPRYEAEDRRRRGHENAPSSLFSPNTPPAAPAWYRFVAGVGVVFISCYASPRFLSSFTGKTLLFFARCLAYDEDNNVARCFRQAFESSMMAFAPALPTSRSRDYSFPRPRGRTMYNAVQRHHPRLLPEKRALRGNELPEEDRYYSPTGSKAVPVTAKDYRAEAQHHAQLRSSKLQESEYFYRVGHQDTGDKLSFEAKRHGDLMKEASKKAAEIILRPQQPEMTGILDIQDLSAAEAVEIVRDFLLKQSIARRFTEVEIIIGTGHYSEASEVRLKPTIERLIKRLDFPFHRSPHSNKAIVVEMLAGDQLF